MRPGVAVVSQAAGAAPQREGPSAELPSSSAAVVHCSLLVGLLLIGCGKQQEFRGGCQGASVLGLLEILQH